MRDIIRKILREMPNEEPPTKGEGSSQSKQVKLLLKLGKIKPIKRGSKFYLDSDLIENRYGISMHTEDYKMLGFGFTYEERGTYGKMVRYWWWDKKLHNEDGPAVDYSDHDRDGELESDDVYYDEYWLNDVQYDYIGDYEDALDKL